MLSSSLVPENDPSVLLTTAGMQQFKPYYTGQADPIKDFGSQRTCSVQKSFRTSDIDEVGDESHLTFFEMLGNFSFGPVGKDDPKDFGKSGYFKRSIIHWAYEFIEKELDLEIDYVSVFDPEKVPDSDWRKGVPFDQQSLDIWEKEVGLAQEKIKRAGVDNFWGPTGNEGPCGPTTEIYVKGIEIWNIVFNEFYCHPDRRLERLETPGVDTGMGLERLAKVAQRVPTIFHTDLFSALVGALMGLPKKRQDPRAIRIIADHLRGATFLLSDGVVPLNKDRGYILRRLLRRAIVKAHIDLGVDLSAIRLGSFIEWFIIPVYKDFYPELEALHDDILQEVWQEQNRFLKTLTRGYHEFQVMARNAQRFLPGQDVFYLFSTYGFPVEVVRELSLQQGLSIDEEGFRSAFQRHQEVSRHSLAKKFGGHGLVLGTGELHAATDSEVERVIRLHTATHLLGQALRDILSSDVQQYGSDIDAKRTRFDFNFPRKLTAGELKAVEDRINQKIQEGLPVFWREMSKEESFQLGAQAAFKEKYPDRVKVYFIGGSLDNLQAAYSKELCGGPHVENTSEIGHFRIIKEESSAAGVRRIRATVE